MKAILRSGFLALAILLALAVGLSQSAEMKLVDLSFDGVTKLILIRGTLEKGDADHFEQISESDSKLVE